MWPRHPQQKNFYPDLPLIENDTVVKLDPDQSQLTTWYTEHAVSFIERNREKPFFLYVAHSMPHVPLFVSSKFSGKTPGGLYGDVIAEIDWSVGRILETLRKTGLDDRTLVIFASDNGPWLSYGNNAGSAGPFREGKGTTFEGGVRVPFIARWPGHVAKGGTSNTPAMTIDLLPTLAALAGAPPVASDRIIDGRDAWPVISGQARREGAARRPLFLLGRGASCRPARQVEAAPAASVSGPRVRRQRWHSRQIRSARARALALRPGCGRRRDHERAGAAPGCRRSS